MIDIPMIMMMSAALWPIANERPLKFRIFENPRWRTAAILKAVKSPYLKFPTTAWRMATKFGKLTQIDLFDSYDR